MFKKLSAKCLGAEAPKPLTLSTGTDCQKQVLNVTTEIPENCTLWTIMLRWLQLPASAL